MKMIRVRTVSVYSICAICSRWFWGRANPGKFRFSVLSVSQLLRMLQGRPQFLPGKRTSWFIFLDTTRFTRFSAFAKSWPCSIASDLLISTVSTRIREYRLNIGWISGIHIEIKRISAIDSANSEPCTVYGSWKTWSWLRQSRLLAWHQGVTQRHETSQNLNPKKSKTWHFMTFQVKQSN